MQGKGEPVSDENLFEEDSYVNAIKPHVSDVWMDGNEEIVMVEAQCPNEDCGQKVVSFFTMPRATSKVLECRNCRTKMLISLPVARDDA